MALDLELFGRAIENLKRQKLRSLLTLLGIIIGIAFFFIGAMISNVFDSSADDLIGYKVQFFIKMVGYGFLVSSMVIGGIIIDDIDKNMKMLMLLFGLLLLIAFTIGIQGLQWSVPESYDTSVYGSSSEAAYEDRPTGYGTPGFEMIYALVAMITVFIAAKIKRLRQ